VLLAEKVNNLRGKPTLRESKPRWNTGNKERKDSNEKKSRYERRVKADPQIFAHHHAVFSRSQVFARACL